VPVCCQNSSAVRWSLEPLPAEAKVILPGFAFRLATTSATLLCGEFAGTTSTLGDATATVIRSKSFSASYCRPLTRCGTITSGPSEVTRKVAPSGAARLTKVAPMVPVAPALLSTRKDCLSFSPNRGTSARATWSVEPPGGNGTTSVTVFSGQPCPWAASAARLSAIAPRYFFM
jgi:hypothetical protein